MLFHPHTLSLIVTHRCTAACDHCCFSCSPEVKDHIPIPNIYRYIDEATELETIQVVVFTGGECFLLGSELDNLMKRASSHGFMTRFVSNGYWAFNPKAATKRLEKLVACGLSEANFSTGDQHAVYVKPEYVRNGAVAAASMGINTVVTIELFKESRFPLDEFVNDPGIKQCMEAGTLALKMAPWMTFEGKTKLTFPKKYMHMVDQGRAAGNTGCHTALTVIAISPRQQLFACCGLPVEEIEEMHLGSLLTASIKQILDRAPDDFLKIWLHLHGPEAVIRYARRFDPTIEMPVNTPHICDACRYMYKHERIKKIVMENPPPNAREISEYYFQTLLLPVSKGNDLSSAKLSRFGDSIPQLRATHAMVTSQRHSCAK